MALQFPISNQSDYKGRIKFDVFQTIPAGLSRTAAAVQSTFQNSTDANLQNAGALINNAVNGQPDSVRLDVGPTSRNNRSQLQARDRRLPQSCSIYLPQSIQIQDGVQFDNMELGVFAAGIESALQNGDNILSAGVQGFVQAFQSVKDAFSNSGSDVARAGLARLATGFLPDAAAGAVRSALATTPAPNTRMIFRNVNLREFSFSFSLMPKSKEEAEAIKEIILFFRTELYPETIGGAVPIAYKFPNKFGISIQYDGKSVATKILKCYLRNFQANYNPNNMAFFEDGNFQEVQISMTFIEDRTLDKNDIIGGF